MTTENTYHYDRYHNNPEIRAHMMASSRTYCKMRYANDPEFRAKCLAQSSEWAKKNKERKKEIIDNWHKNNKEYWNDYQRNYKLGVTKKDKSFDKSYDRFKNPRYIEIINIPRTITFYA